MLYMTTFFDHINTEMIKKQMGRGYVLVEQNLNVEYKKMMEGDYGTVLTCIVILGALAILYGFIYLLFTPVVKRCYNAYLGIPTGDGLSSHSRRISNTRLVNRTRSPRVTTSTITMKSSYDSNSDDYKRGINRGRDEYEEEEEEEEHYINNKKTQSNTTTTKKKSTTARPARRKKSASFTR